MVCSTQCCRGYGYFCCYWRQQTATSEARVTVMMPNPNNYINECVCLQKYLMTRLCTLVLEVWRHVNDEAPNKMLYEEVLRKNKVCHSHTEFWAWGIYLFIYFLVKRSLCTADSFVANCEQWSTLGSRCESYLQEHMVLFRSSLCFLSNCLSATSVRTDLQLEIFHWIHSIIVHHYWEQ